MTKGACTLSFPCLAGPTGWLSLFKTQWLLNVLDPKWAPEVRLAPRQSQRPKSQANVTTRCFCYPARWFLTWYGNGQVHDLVRHASKLRLQIVLIMYSIVLIPRNTEYFCNKHCRRESLAKSWLQSAYRYWLYFVKIDASWSKVEAPPC